jgi:hypothetical protein
MVLQPKTFLGGYPLIIGWTWMAIVDAYIGCQSRNMTIYHGTSTKQSTLYPPTKPIIDLETPLWVDGEESDEEGETHQVLSIDQYLAIRDKIKDDKINDFIVSSYSLGNTDILEHVMKPKTQISLSSTTISPTEHEPMPQ